MLHLFYIVRKLTQFLRVFSTLAAEQFEGNQTLWGTGNRIPCRCVGFCRRTVALRRGRGESARGAAKRASALAAEARALEFEAELEAERQSVASKRSASAVASAEARLAEAAVEAAQQAAAAA